MKLNWLALMFWGLMLLASVVTLLYGAVLAAREDQHTTRLQHTLQGLELHVRDMAYQSRRVYDGSDDAMDRLSDLRIEVGQRLSWLDFREPAGLDRRLQTEWQTMSEVWTRLAARIEQLTRTAMDRGVVRDVDTYLNEIRDVTAALEEPLDTLANRLMEVSAPRSMIDLGYRLSWQTQKVLDRVHAVKWGEGDSRRMVDTLRDDLQQLSEILFQMQDRAGVDIAPQVDAVAMAFQPMLAPTAAVMTLAGDYRMIRNLALTIDQLSVSLLEHVRTLNARVRSESHQSIGMAGWFDVEGKPWRRELPWLVGVSGLLGLVGCVWTVTQFVRRRQRAVAIRHRQSREAMNRLLAWLNRLGQKDLTMEATVTDEIPGEWVDSMNRAIREWRQWVHRIRTACSELSGAIARSEPLMTGLQSDHRAQADGLRNVVTAMGRIRETLEGVGRAVDQSSGYARQTDQAAEDSDPLMDRIVTDMSRLQGRIEQTGDGLNRLGDRARQVSETVTVMEEVTEQAQVLALNASIQASMAGEAENGFTVMANEARRLAERFTEATGRIIGIARIIQQEAAAVIQEWESTSGEVVDGSRRMAQVRQSQHELRRIVREWQGGIDPLANLASVGIDSAHQASTDLADMDQAVEKAERAVRQAALTLGEIQSALEQLEWSASEFRLPD